MPNVLIVGGSGYLGQFLVDHFAKEGWAVAFTYFSSDPPPFNSPNAQGFKVDIVSGSGLAECFAGPAAFDAVINCVALSQPAACEKDPEKTRAINVPTKLLEAVVEHAARTGGQPLFIQLSTDQVYSGAKAWSSDVSDATEPINEYGRSKLAGEAAVQSLWPHHHVILRSSLIFGPLAPAAPVPRPLFIQFVDQALASGQTTAFFEDEWRNAVHVNDILRVCKTFIQRHVVAEKSAEGGGAAYPCGVFNMGGPERLSRVDIATKVAEARGHDKALIVPVPSASVNRGVNSPPDISMTSARLEEAVGFGMTPFSDALKLIFT